MKTFLPKVLLAVVLLICLSPVFSHSVFAATPTDTPTPTIDPAAAVTTPDPTGYVEDQEVTFVGKNAARSGLLLDWALSASNSAWVYLQPDSHGNLTQNPLKDFWLTIVLNVVFPILVLFVLVGAFILIATRGKNLTIRKFIVRFIIVAILCYFSWSIIQFIYQLADIIQLFFLKSPTYAPDDISQKDLLSVGWDYSSFTGLRSANLDDTESAFVSLLLVKLTSVTYYVMVGVLLLRKIIMWFFIILSPIFPLLLLFGTIRNTAKIWVGEFFRWVMYAPLFAVLLAGLVHIWTVYIPMNFTNYTPTNNAHTPDDLKNGVTTTTDHFPTAINILLGGPNQQVGINNSVNYTETFAEYVVALIMLWVVILLPFILLQVFLDYMNSISIRENSWTQQLLARASFRSPPPPTSSPSPPPTKYQTAGLAKSLPFGTSFKMSERMKDALPMQQPASVAMSKKSEGEILQLTNLSVPTMRDIAKYETGVIHANANTKTQSSSQSSQVTQTLKQIANPDAARGSQQEAYRQIRSKLITESQKGNILAKNILQASATTATGNVSEQTVLGVQQAMNTVFNPASARTATEKTKVSELRQIIVQANEKGNLTAKNVVSTMNSVNKTEIENTQRMLQEISNPEGVTNANQQALFRQLRTELVEASRQGNSFASNIMTAVNSVTTGHPDLMSVVKVREQLQQEAKKGNKLANDLLKAAESDDVILQVQQLLKNLQDAQAKGDPIAIKILELFAQSGVPLQPDITGLPVANRTQSVSIEDYEAVRQMWAENYEKMDVPQSVDGTIPDRISWLQSDIADIDKTITLLSSHDQPKVAEGMQHVSGILPFLLIGGFSQSEIIAYLKAKLQAAKAVLTNLGKKEEEEETQLPTDVRTNGATAVKQMAAEVPVNTVQTPPPLPENKIGKQ